MLDPMAALGLAGNIVQFLDFSINLVGKAHEIHKSIDGTLTENLDAEVVAQRIRKLQSKLRIDQTRNTSYDSEIEGLLEGLCSSCDETAKELLNILEPLKVQGKKTTWKSMRHAIKSVRGKGAVLEISGRLDNFQDLLQTTILVELRKKIDLQLIANSDNFKNLETSTQNVILAVNENRSVFTTVIDKKTAELKELYQEEVSASAFRHEDVKATIAAKISGAHQGQVHEHETTRREIAERAATEAVELKAHIEERSKEIKDLIMATQRAKGDTERKRLKEKANAATVSLVAMDLFYNSLIGILAQTNPNHGWKLRPYPDRDYEPPVPLAGDLTEYEAQTEVPRVRRVHGKSNPFEYGGRAAEPRELHSPTPSVAWTPYGTNQIPQNEGLSGQNYRPSHPSPLNAIPPRTAPPFPGMPPQMFPPSNEVPQPDFPYYYSQMGGMPQHGSQYPYTAWPPPPDPSEVGDPELEKKLLAVEELMKAQTLDYEKAKKELAERDAKEAKNRAEAELEKRAAKAAAAVAKKAAEEKTETAKRVAEERAEWEKRLDEEKRKGEEEKAAWAKKFDEEKEATLAKGAENARKQMEAKQRKAEEVKEKERAIAAAVQAARDEMLADKRAEEELRATFMIPWPSFWKRG